MLDGMYNIPSFIPGWELKTISPNELIGADCIYKFNSPVWFINSTAPIVVFWSHIGPLTYSFIYSSVLSLYLKQFFGTS